MTGHSGEMAITWATSGSCKGAGLIEYGTSTALGASATATCVMMTSGMTTPLGMFNGLMTGLLPNTKYFYSTDAVFNSSFVNEPSRHIYAICKWIPHPSCTTQLRKLRAWIASNNFTTIFLPPSFRR